MILLVPTARNPNQFETKRNWLEGWRSLISGRVYMLTVLLTWPEAPDPQVWGRSPTRRPSPSQESPGEGTWGMWDQRLWVVQMGAAILGYNHPRHGCLLIWEPFQPEAVFRGLITNPRHAPLARFI